MLDSQVHRDLEELQEIPERLVQLEMLDHKDKGVILVHPDNVEVTAYQDHLDHLAIQDPKDNQDHLAHQERLVLKEI